ncbi:MAG: CRISPR-associated protein Cmr3 [Pseudomonadota bacterium]|nr:CRISPR-associated protein Cmr3 [Pseudomonadota bacterium]
MTEYRFIEPLDVLYLRGNKLFGDGGAHGAALMPPWPSLAAGALRSRLLTDHGVDLAAFAAGTAVLDPALAACLGTPSHPGSFRITALTLAQRKNDQIEPCFPLPADVVIQGQGEQQRRHYLHPRQLSARLAGSYPLPEWPTLTTDQPAKPESGYWLNRAGLAAYLGGEPLRADHLVKTSVLWQLDPRLGIALDSHRRTAADSRIYTAETVALCRDVGFLAGVQGADGLLPQDGLLRLGGDGRAARFEVARVPWPEPDWRRIAQERRFRLILATPGLFTGGWRLPGLNDNHEWCWGGGTAQLVSACVSRAEVVSGWDLANWRPKPALRIAPVGSVYGFRDFTGDLAALQEGLLPGLIEDLEPMRRAEGFNNVLIAAWPR